MNTPARTAEDVVRDLEVIAVAGTASAGLAARTSARVGELCDEGFRLVREDERRRARKSLGQAWSAWLDLMMSVKLPEAGGKSLLQDVFDLEPGLREQFLAVLNGEERG